MTEKKPELKQVIVIRRDLKMRQGKAVSQGAHASGEFMREQLLRAYDGGFINLTPIEVEWMRDGMAKITVRTDSEEQFFEIKAKAERIGLKVRVIRDSGRTEFKNIPTITALAIGPDRADVIDTVTGKLDLL